MKVWAQYDDKGVVSIKNSINEIYYIWINDGDDDDTILYIYVFIFTCMYVLIFKVILLCLIVNKKHSLYNIYKYKIYKYYILYIPL